MAEKYPFMIETITNAKFCSIYFDKIKVKENGVHRRKTRSEE